MYFAEKDFVKPKSGAKRRKSPDWFGIFSSPNVDRFQENFQSFTIWWGSFLYERKSPAKQEDINEALKEQDQMEWVRRMNNIRNRAEEIVREEILLK
ncbi:MAG: TnpV protein [Oscillospiraceae bacterium]|nr:TnpV protein [Oscillospiraceae bacterium]MBQ2861270.1 TnpV protein [Oscillospiraceae bacterium]MBQ3560730.1 TnpV protein [Oscillospiraceae bacterium]MBQ4118554.1 TnpV protein [Oscillospiraceae bacterium]MBQ6699424.1 TnpV protein [Oscillospiraceae bacterium]